MNKTEMYQDLLLTCAERMCYLSRFELPANSRHRTTIVVYDAGPTLNQQWVKVLCLLVMSAVCKCSYRLCH